MPHVFSRSNFNSEWSKLDLLDVNGNCTYNGYEIKCKTYGELVVGFQTRTLPKRWGIFSRCVEALASFNDVKQELAQDTTIGNLIGENDHFLFYERPAGRWGSYQQFDVVVVGTHSFSRQASEAIQNEDQICSIVYDWLKV